LVTALEAGVTHEDRMTLGFSRVNEN
jgi:hypothetical protein